MSNRMPKELITFTSELAAEQILCLSWETMFSALVACLAESQGRAGRLTQR
jgi:hypothetical protein